MPRFIPPLTSCFAAGFEPRRAHVALSRQTHLVRRIKWPCTAESPSKDIPFLKLLNLISSRSLRIYVTNHKPFAYCADYGCNRCGPNVAMYTNDIVTPSSGAANWRSNHDAQISRLAISHGVVFSRLLSYLLIAARAEARNNVTQHETAGLFSNHD
jgi:hypothetical protein